MARFSPSPDHRSCAQGEGTGGEVRRVRLFGRGPAIHDLEQFARRGVQSPQDAGQERTNAKPVMAQAMDDGRLHRRRSRFGGAPFEGARGPGEAGAKTDQEQLVARTNAPGRKGLTERDRDRGGRRIAIAFQVDEHPLGR